MDQITQLDRMSSTLLCQECSPDPMPSLVGYPVPFYGSKGYSENASRSAKKNESDPPSPPRKNYPEKISEGTKGKLVCQKAWLSCKEQYFVFLLDVWKPPKVFRRAHKARKTSRSRWFVWTAIACAFPIRSAGGLSVFKFEARIQKTKKTVSSV